MQSNKSLAVWASQTYSQTGGVNNWSQYQLSLTGTSAKLNVYSTNTTSTVFSFYGNTQGNTVSTGDTLLLSTNGSTFTSGTAGVVTTTAPTVAAPGAFSLASGSVGVSIGPQTYITPDGLTLFASAYSSSFVYIYQYSLATAFDITTLTYTSKSFTGTYFGSGYGYGFTFKPDGSTFYVISGSVVKAYALSTAFDISTANTTPIGTVTLTMPVITGNWNNSVGLNALRISPDGTKLIACNTNAASYQSSSPYNNFAVYTMSVPWVLGSCATTTTNYTNTALYYNAPYYFCDFNLAPDGSGLVIGTGSYGGYNCNTSYMGMLYIGMSNAYDLTTATFSNWTYSNGGSSSTGNLVFIWYLNATGTSISIYTNRSYRGSSTVNYYTKYNVNISSFGLGSAPTAGYFPAPTVKVSAETTAARVNLFDYQVYMASSSTTQAVVYKPAAGYIATGDTLSLNGTTTVTTSSVTEGSTGGVAAVPIYTAANRSYAGKNYTFPSNTSGTRCFRFSADGSQVFALLTSGMSYGIGIYKFNLSTPWDISTASFGDMVLPMTLNNVNTGSFDFSADGLRLITWGMYITGSGAVATSAYGYVYDHTLSQPFNIGTATYVGAFASNVDVGSNYVTAIRFTPNGQQVLYSYNNTTTFRVVWSALGTAYRVQTSGAINIYFSTTSSPVYDAIMTPDGLNLITLGQITTSNTIGTAYSMATATTTNNPASATNKWAWPTGTISSTAQSNVGCLSPDGTKLYMSSEYTSIAVCWQFNVMVIPQTSYTCTFPTQGSAPTSVVVPDRGVAQTITTTLSGGVMTFAASTVATSARGIGMKITSPRQFTTITNATLNMWHS